MTGVGEVHQARGCPVGGPTQVGEDLLKTMYWIALQLNAQLELKTQWQFHLLMRSVSNTLPVSSPHLHNRGAFKKDGLTPRTLIYQKNYEKVFG